MVGISGLKFTKSANEPIIGENNKRLRKFKLDGLTHSIKFSVSFTVVEGELGIQDLQIDTRPDIQFKLRYFLERYIYFNEKNFFFQRKNQQKKNCRIVNEKSLKYFFTCFSKYCETIDFRYSIFSHFKKKFPDNVTLCAGKLEPNFTFSYSNNSKKIASVAFEFICVWDIWINEENQIAQSIQLIPRVLRSRMFVRSFACSGLEPLLSHMSNLSKKILFFPSFLQKKTKIEIEQDENDSDLEDLIKKLPTMFATLCQLKGIERALQVVIEIAIGKTWKMRRYVYKSMRKKK